MIQLGLLLSHGILFWDTIINNSPADIYSKRYPNFKTQSTNPCFSGDTLIAVADGRNAISIKQLAEEGKDVPVYSMDKTTGMLEIKTGRNPRITGYDQKLVRVHLDDGSYVDTTPNHKFILNDGSIVEAKDLNSGDSLPRFSKNLEKVKKASKDYYRINTNTRDQTKNKIFEHRMIAKYNDPKTWDEVYNSTVQNGYVNTGGLVVHHKNFKQLDNSPENLQIMTFADHTKLHNEIDTQGEKNGRWYDISSEKIKEHALEFTKILNRRFSSKEWIKYAAENKLPKRFSEFRKNELGDVVTMAKACAKELGMENIDLDPRTQRICQNLIEQGYLTRIIDKHIFVEKTCEVCKNTFNISHKRREQSICSMACGIKSGHYTYYHSDDHMKELNSNPNIKIIRDQKRTEYVENKMKNVKLAQAKIYSDLKFALGRPPMRLEWEESCKTNKISFRTGRKLKYSFKDYKEVIKAGNEYNHKVVKVEELSGNHTVYNITVDDHHTVSVITKINNKRGNDWYTGIVTLQCGELPLSRTEKVAAYF